MLQRRTMRVLVAAQLLGACGLAAGGTAGALLAEHLTGSPTAAGLPLSLLVLGSGVGAVATTRLMDRAGRRAGLAAAYLAGAVGAGLVVARRRGAAGRCCWRAASCWVAATPPSCWRATPPPTSPASADGRSAR
jgi:MFS family permease